jgi:uncharacterized protein
MSGRRARARPLLLATLAAGLVLAPPTRGQGGAGLPPIPSFTGYVTDAAQVIEDGRQAQLEGFLDQLQKKTGVQFAVLTVRSTAPEDPGTYKTRVFNQWGIGDKERDDGLLMVVAMEQRAIRFETGYGLEGTLPDGWQSRMTRDLMIPRFRAGEPAEGIIAGVLATSQRIAAEKSVKLEWDGRELAYDSGPAVGRLPGRSGERESGRIPAWTLFLVLVFIIFVVLPALAASRRGRGRSFWDSSGWGGGFGGFGGGFGGGGGGGGGGSSFGGFGGGSSGGGGGGGNW